MYKYLTKKNSLHKIVSSGIALVALIIAIYIIIETLFF